MAGWTYWVVHVPYLAQKPQSLLIAFSWAISPSGELFNSIKGIRSYILQAMVLLVFLMFLYVSTKGVKILKVVGSVAGMSYVCYVVIIYSFRISCTGYNW